MKLPDIIIAIDGYSSTGKSTLARLIAEHFGFLYLDSGALYRGVTLYALEKGFIGKDGAIDEAALKAALPDLGLDFKAEGTFIGDRCIEKEIRTLEVSGHVSPISAIPFVREYVDERLHAFGQRKRIVMDGRDIGTTVFPDAELKIFVTASPEIRAQRRYDELQAKGEKGSYEEILENVKERDRIDTSRAVSPLRKADDAIELDNSHMTISEQKEWLAARFRKVVGAE